MSFYFKRGVLVSLNLTYEAIETGNRGRGKNLNKIKLSKVQKEATQCIHLTHKFVNNLSVLSTKMLHF